jgi:hypothetical protein
LDQAVVASSFGPGPATLLAKLIWYSDHFDLAYGEVDRRSTFPDCAVAEVAQVVADAGRQHFGQAIERQRLEQQLFRMIDGDRVSIEVRDRREHWSKWVGSFLAFVHIWLQGELEPRRALHGAEWYALQRSVEDVLRKAAKVNRA